MRLWLISYDISDDRNRRTVEKLLLAKGKRVNYSVFECYLSAFAFESLWAALAAAIDTGTDSLRCYPLCTWCEQNICLQGKGKKHENPTDWVL